LRILFWIVRALAVLLLVRMLLRALFGSRPPATRASGGAGRPHTPERIGGELVRDPQCGTYIPKARAIVSGSGDAALYFCSTQCRDEFAKVRSSKAEVRS
jgi:uncharacterized protein